MKIGKVIILSFAALLFVVSCNTDKPTPPDPKPEPIEGTDLVSGAAITSSAPDGIGPLSFAWALQTQILGSANISSPQYPDLFCYCTSSISNARLSAQKGYFYVRFNRVEEDGSLVYDEPQMISKYPWTIGDGNIHIIQTSAGVFAYKFASNKISVSSWDEGTMSFSDFFLTSKVVPGAHTIITLDVACAPGASTGKAFFLCYGVKAEKPDPDEYLNSYYLSDGSYNGVIPYGTVYVADFDFSKWTVSSALTQLTPSDKVISWPQAVCAVKSSKGEPTGCVVGNKMGVMKYVSLQDGTSTPYILGSNGEVIVNKHNIGAISLVAGKTSELITSGEGEMYHYALAGTTSSGAPIYNEGKTIKMVNAPLYAGSTCNPTVVDWDGDGILDIVSGNSEGHIQIYKNYGTNKEPAFTGYEYLKVEGEIFRIRAGYYEIQGPGEGCWGYVGPNVFDWNGDGLPDIVLGYNDGKYMVMLNVGTKTQPKLLAPQVLKVDGMELYASWRQRPGLCTVDGHTYMVVLDVKGTTEECLHLYERVDNYNVKDLGRIQMFNGQYIFGNITKVNEGRNLGTNGRKKVELCDWNGDGKVDVIIGCCAQGSFPYIDTGIPYARGNGLQVVYFENVGDNDNIILKYPSQFQFKGLDYHLGPHENSPCLCALGDTSKGPNLLVGCESGRFVFFSHKDLTTITLWK